MFLIFSPFIANVGEFSQGYFLFSLDMINEVFINKIKVT